MHISQGLLYSLYFVILTIIVIALNVVTQLLRRRVAEPPMVISLLPFLGSAISYGRNPYTFFFQCRQKHGDIFSFLLLGKKMTVCLGTEGNDFILNAKLQDVNAEEIYTPLTTPVFGEGVVYDCSNAKMMEQKKFLKYGLTTEALQTYVPLFETEFHAHLKKLPGFHDASKGRLDTNQLMSELTIFMASRALQGKEVRAKFDTTFAELYHDLDMGFTPINFMIPWLPLPQNQRRDRAQRILSQTYISIIEARRTYSGVNEKLENDMIQHLMSARYKNGQAVPDKEIAHMMIALLMAGQHSSSSIGAWITLRLASRPDIMEELYEEQVRVLGPDAEAPFTFDGIKSLTLHALVVRETLRLHAPIHSIMRAVKSPLVAYTGRLNERKAYTIPTSHVLLSAPGVTAQSPEHFSNPEVWDPHRWETITDAKEGTVNVNYGYDLVTKGASSPYLPFGAGRHRCIGEQFAYLQLGTITALMVREFKLSSVPGKEGALPGTNYASLFTRPLDPAVVAWEKR